MVATHFTDGAAYDAFMGRWTCAAGEIFLDWVAPPGGARWLDVGCGTGIFTELVLDTCSPAGVIAVDPAAAQVDLARNKPVAKRADFRVADAQTLPFENGAFDVVASALVINFIADRPRAIAEMRRVCRVGGVIAGYVWDFAGERSPNSPLRLGLSQMGVELPAVHGADDTRIEALSALYAGSGLRDIVTRTIDVTMSFPDFAEFFQTQAPGYTRTGQVVAALSETDRAKLIARLQASLPPLPDGSMSYSARAIAIKARRPGKAES